MGVGKFGERDMREVRKNTFGKEGNPVQISERGLGCLAAFKSELKSR